MDFWNRFVNPHFSLLLLLLATTAARSNTAAPSGEAVERMVAVVNGKLILYSELQEKTDQFKKEMEHQKKPEVLEPKAGLSRRVLDQMINEILVDSEIEKRGFTANESTVDGAVNTVMKQNRIDTLEDFRRVLRDEGMSLEDYRKTVKRQIENSRLMNEVIRPRVQVSDSDIEAAYQRKLSADGKKWKYRVQMIFKKGGKEAKKKVETLRKEIERGKSFESVADQETDGAGKGEGGLIGEVSPSDLQPQLAKVIEALPEGKISETIETPQGAYLLKSGKRISVDSALTPEMKEQLREELTKDETARQFDLFVRTLRDKAQIEIVL